MTRYVNLIQTHVRRKIELISILRIICCVRSAFAYCEPSLKPGLQINMTLDDAGANVSVYKNSFVAQTETWLLKCELLRRNASNTRIEIEIKSIPGMSLKGGPDGLAIP